MSFPVGTGGEEQRGCGEDGCDCSLEGTAKHKQCEADVTKCTLPEGGVRTCFPCRAFVLNETQSDGAHKEED